MIIDSLFYYKHIVQHFFLKCKASGLSTYLYTLLLMSINTKKLSFFNNSPKPRVMEEVYFYRCDFNIKTCHLRNNCRPCRRWRTPEFWTSFTVIQSGLCEYDICSSNGDI